MEKFKRIEASSSEESEDTPFEEEPEEGADNSSDDFGDY